MKISVMLWWNWFLWLNQTNYTNTTLSGGKKNYKNDTPNRILISNSAICLWEVTATSHTVTAWPNCDFLIIMALKWSSFRDSNVNRRHDWFFCHLQQSQTDSERKGSNVTVTWIRLIFHVKWQQEDQSYFSHILIIDWRCYEGFSLLSELKS